MVIVLIRHKEFCMNKMVELYVYDFTIVSMIRICMLNSTEEDCINRGANMGQHWAQEHAD